MVSLGDRCRDAVALFFAVADATDSRFDCGRWDAANRVSDARLGRAAVCFEVAPV